MNRSFFLKFFEVFCLILVAIGLTQLHNSASEWQFVIVSNWNNIFMVLGVMLLVSATIAFFWQESSREPHLHYYFQTIIAFYVAFQITTYGSAKILKTQFQAPNYILETPIGDLNGFWLTWTYYGYSQTMAYILGWTQVIGAILLLFQRTRLIGVFILLPVLVNIDLIDHFYTISPLAYYNSLHYTFILIFLMLLDYDKLKATFLSFHESISINTKTIVLNLLRVVVIGGAFLHIYYLKNSFQPKTKLNGVWQVESMTKNRTKIPIDSTWAKIYFEWRYGCLFKYSPDKFQEKDLAGSYQINKKKQTVRIDFGDNPQLNPDTLQLSYNFKTDSLLTLHGFFQRDSIRLYLKRLK